MKKLLIISCLFLSSCSSLSVKEHSLFREPQEVVNQRMEENTIEVKWTPLLVWVGILCVVSYFSLKMLSKSK